MDKKPASNVILFLGAGASKFAGVPDTRGFVTEFIDQLPDIKDKELVELIVSRLRKWLKQNNKEDIVDIELLMETLDKLSRTDDEPLLSFYEDCKFILEGYRPKKPILEQLKSFVRKRADVPKENVGYLEPLLGYIQEFSPLDIFSVNYDICIEQFCDVYQRSYRDGFEVEWNKKVFDYDPGIDIWLYKLHGSTNWYRTTGGGSFKSMIKTDGNNIETLGGERAEALMLYPMRKWEYAEPLLDNLLALKDRLKSESCRYIIVVGYSFRDDYIKNIFWDAAKKNKEFVLLLVDPRAFETYSTKLECYPTGRPSSLKGRVICLPFYFEKAIHSTRTIFLNSLRDAIGVLKTLKETELQGKNMPSWIQCLRPLADAHYVDKLDEIISEKLYFNIRKASSFKNLKPENRALDIKTLYFKLNKDLALLLEILFKRCISLLSNNRTREGHESFLDLAAALHLFLIQKLSVKIDRDGIIIEPNIEGTGYFPVKTLNELFGRLYSQSELPWFDHERIERLRSFSILIINYLSEWRDGKLNWGDYVSTRSSSIIFEAPSQPIKKITEILNLTDVDFNNQNNENVTELKKLILETEKAIITKVIEGSTKDLQIFSNLSIAKSITLPKGKKPHNLDDEENTS